MKKPTAEDFYNTSVCYAFIGMKEDAELFYQKTLDKCDGILPVFSDKGFEDSLFFKMALLRRALNLCK